MRQELIQYVELLFAGTPNAEDIKQEILQNTLDRYDDLIAQGKSPEAAYRLAISGIGDINEILGGDSPNSQNSQDFRQAIHEEVEDIHHRKMRAVAIAMYILCPIPLFILSEFGLDTMGLCFTLLLVAAATALIIMSRGKKDNDQESISHVHYVKEESSRTEPGNSLKKLLWPIGIAVYFILSFSTGAWYITWILFPIIGCIQGLINACLDLKEAVEYEN